jgi:hypothetical protein
MDSELGATTMKPEAARLRLTTESKPGEGTKCDRPNREAFAAAARLGGPIKEEDLPKCGARAVVLVVTDYENAPTARWNCCEECRPREFQFTSPPPTHTVDN